MIVSTSTSLVTPDSLLPSPTTSAPIMTSDPQALIFQHPGQKLKRLQKYREGPIMALIFPYLFENQRYHNFWTKPEK